MPRRPKQLRLDLGSPSAPKRRRSRLPVTARPTVPHRVRPWHDARHPVHVTLRARKDVPFLRKEAVLKRVVQTFRRANRDASFQVVHFSVQSNHVHLVVEASSREVLAKRMNGLTTWLARRVNAAIGRRGRVWNGRYHRHDLATPTEVRNTILYVLQNRRKHVLQSQGYDPGGFDVFSSGPWFAGWEDAMGARLAELREEHLRILGPGPPIAAPRRWLTKDGWRRGRGGLLRVSEVPRARS